MLVGAVEVYQRITRPVAKQPAGLEAAALAHCNILEILPPPGQTIQAAAAAAVPFRTTEPPGDQV